MIKLIVVVVVSLIMLGGCGISHHNCLYEVYNNDDKQTGVQCDSCSTKSVKCRGAYCILTLTFCAKGTK